MSLSSLFGSDTPDADPIRVDIPLGDLFHLFQNARRRAMIRMLGGEPVGTVRHLGSLAEAIAADESGPEYSRDDRQRVYIALYQSHAPTLNEFGLIEYLEESRSDVRVRPRAAPVARVLDRFEREVAVE